MKDSISECLHFLALGLRPYVAARVDAVLHNSELASQIGTWDAQSLMVFMWERWNDLFRSELSFVERSLISELRDFRNRWAHQDGLEERDVYRVLDNVERLLIAIESSQVKPVSRLRRESLNRLWTSELEDDEKQRRIRVLWPYLLCGSSALALGTAIVSFGPTPWSWILSILLFVALIRLAWMQSARESRQRPGPHECTDCGRIIYTIGCPYCRVAESDHLERPGTGALHRFAGAWSGTRFAANSEPKLQTPGNANAVLPVQNG
jgi:hypothetical protein